MFQRSIVNLVVAPVFVRAIACSSGMAIEKESTVGAAW